MGNISKIRPETSIEFDNGVDGRDCRYNIRYSCPCCNKRIHEKDIACTECGTFFDWSKRATIKIIRTVEWE